MDPTDPTMFEQRVPPARRVARAGRGRRYRPLLSAVVVVAAAIPIALLVGGSSGSDNHASNQVPAAAVTAPPTPSATTLMPSATAGEPITPQAAAQILISLLPRAGKTSQLSGQFTTNFAASQLLYDDGHGAAQLSIAIGEGQSFVCDAQAGTPGCQTLANGDQLFVSQGPEYPPGKPRPSSDVGVVTWDVQLQRPDGVQVDVSEWNAPTEKDSPAEPSRTAAHRRRTHGDRPQRSVADDDPSAARRSSPGALHAERGSDRRPELSRERAD